MKTSTPWDLHSCIVCFLFIALVYGSSAAVVDQVEEAPSTGSATMPSSLVDDADSHRAAGAGGIGAAVERTKRSTSMRGRRHSLSVTNDLASLAEMIHGDSNRRRLNKMMSFLDEVGKRSASVPDYADYSGGVEYQRNRAQLTSPALRRLARQ